MHVLAGTGRRLLEEGGAAGTQRRTNLKLAGVGVGVDTIIVLPCRVVQSTPRLATDLNRAAGTQLLAAPTALPLPRHMRHPTSSAKSHQPARRDDLLRSHLLPLTLIFTHLSPRTLLGAAIATVTSVGAASS